MTQDIHYYSKREKDGGRTWWENTGSRRGQNTAEQTLNPVAPRLRSESFDGFSRSSFSPCKGALSFGLAPLLLCRCLVALTPLTYWVLQHSSGVTSVTGQDSAVVPPPYTLAEAISGLTRILSPSWIQV